MKDISIPLEEHSSLWALKSDFIQNVLSSIPDKLQSMSAHVGSQGPPDIDALFYPYEVVKGVATLNVSGTIYPLGYIDTDPVDTWYDPRILQNTFFKLKEDESVTSVHINVDCPGGNASFIDVASYAFDQLTKTKDTHVYVSTYLCSAAYWIFCTASRIYATSLSEVGSIGVYMTKYDMTKFYSDNGIDIRIIATGKRKADSSRFTASTQEVLSSLQQRVNEYGDMFFNRVSVARGLETKTVAGMEGQAFMATKALEYNLIDEIILTQSNNGGFMKEDPTPVAKNAVEPVKKEPVKTEPVKAEPVKTEGMTGEDVRTLTSRALAAGLPADAVEGILRAKTLEEGTQKIFEHLGTSDNGPSHKGAHSRTTLISDKDDKIYNAITDGLIIQAGFDVEEPAAGAIDFSNASFMGIVDEYLRAHNKYSFGMSETDRLGIVFASSGGGHTTSDFKELIHTTAKTIVYREYINESSVWTVLCREVDANDFGQINAVTLSDFPRLEEMDEKGRFRSGVLKEKGEGYRVKKRGVQVGLTFEMMVGDQFGVFSDILISAASAARAMEDELFFEYLLANPTMKDGTQMFSEANGNMPGEGQPPTLESIQAGRTCVRRYKSTNGRFRRINPEYILTSEKHASNVDVLLTSAGHTGDHKSALVKNPLTGKLKHFSDPSIDDSENPDGWYLFCPKKQAPAFQASRLKGHKTPFVVRNADHATDSIIYTVRHVIGFGAIEPQGIYFNPGK